MKDKLAMGKVKLAIERIAHEYPLHAGILARWNVEENAAVGTMGVGFRDDVMRLLFNPEFVTSLKLDVLEGVLHHEVNHVIFGHVLHQPEPDENRTARTIAEEVTVNEWVPGKLPDDCVLLADYPFLPENEDTETRYGRLSERIEDSEDGAPTVDNHATWQEIAAAADDAQDSISMDFAAALEALSDGQRDSLDEDLLSIAEAAAGGFGIGTGRGNACATLGRGTAGVSWQTLLRRYVGRQVEVQPVYGRPPRRFPAMAGIIPGRAHRAGKPMVMAVIDTSASMTTPMLSDISEELGVMARNFDVLVVECDTKVQAVFLYKPIKAVHGRGGTSFVEPLSADFLGKHRPDIVVYFTDGYGLTPENHPAVPVA